MNLSVTLITFFLFVTASYEANFSDGGATGADHCYRSLKCNHSIDTATSLHQHDVGFRRKLVLPDIGQANLIHSNDFMLAVKRRHHQAQQVKLPAVKRGVLVIGCAGFIGYHLTLALHRTGQWPSDQILGVDHFTVEYSPALKRQREQLLWDATGVRIYDFDACRGDFAAHFSSETSFSVVFLMASAVRNERRNFDSRQSYTSALRDCFANITRAVMKINENNHDDVQTLPPIKSPFFKKT